MIPKSRSAGLINRIKFCTWMNDRAKTSTAPNHLVIFVNVYRITCRTLSWYVQPCCDYLYLKNTIQIPTHYELKFSGFSFISLAVLQLIRHVAFTSAVSILSLAVLQLILHVAFTSAVYEIPVWHNISFWNPKLNPVLPFYAYLFIYKTIRFSQRQGTEGEYIAID